MKMKELNFIKPWRKVLMYILIEYLVNQDGIGKSINEVITDIWENICQNPNSPDIFPSIKTRTDAQINICSVLKPLITRRYVDFSGNHGLKSWYAITEKGKEYYLKFVCDSKVLEEFGKVQVKTQVQAQVQEQFDTTAAEGGKMIIAYIDSLKATIRKKEKVIDDLKYQVKNNCDANINEIRRLRSELHDERVKTSQYVSDSKKSGFNMKEIARVIVNGGGV